MTTYGERAAEFRARDASILETEDRDEQTRIARELLEELMEEGDGSMDWAPGYAPGSLSGDMGPSKGLLLANWNDWPGLESIVESMGYETNWSDMVSLCDGCNLAIQTEPAHVWWEMPGALVGSEILCPDCIQTDPAEYLESIATMEPVRAGYLEQLANPAEHGWILAYRQRDEDRYATWDSESGRYVPTPAIPLPDGLTQAGILESLRSPKPTPPDRRYQNHGPVAAILAVKDLRWPDHDWDLWIRADVMGEAMIRLNLTADTLDGAVLIDSHGPDHGLSVVLEHGNEVRIREWCEAIEPRESDGGIDKWLLDYLVELPDLLDLTSKHLESTVQAWNPCPGKRIVDAALAYRGYWGDSSGDREWLDDNALPCQYFQDIAPLDDPKGERPIHCPHCEERKQA